ncbi:hypothetical protein NFI96_006178, partial [Prochilodus magdalenae]
ETSAQTIDPLVVEVQLPEGDDLTLSCNYTSSSTNDVLQWYRQSPGSSPEFLLYIYPSGGETSAQTIDPLVGEVQLPEGDDLTLSCNYTTGSRTTGDTLFWYRQSPGSSPEFLLYIDLFGTQSDPPPRMSAVVDNVLKRLDLKISSVAVSDSVLYYCALQPTVTGNPDTLQCHGPSTSLGWTRRAAASLGHRVACSSKDNEAGSLVTSSGDLEAVNWSGNLEEAGQEAQRLSGQGTWKSGDDPDRTGDTEAV